MWTFPTDVAINIHKHSFEDLCMWSNFRYLFDVKPLVHPTENLVSADLCKDSQLQSYSKADSPKKYCKHFQGLSFTCWLCTNGVSLWINELDLQNVSWVKLQQEMGQTCPDVKSLASLREMCSALNRMTDFPQFPGSNGSNKIWSVFPGTRQMLPQMLEPEQWYRNLSGMFYTQWSIGLKHLQLRHQL